jgi:DME family drug/metabolite transporter
VIPIKQFFILIGAIFFGTLPIFVRNLDLNPFQILFFRVFFATIFLISFMFFFKQRFIIEDFKLIIVLGLINIATMFCYISAIKYIEASTAALLLYMAPVYVVPLSHFMLQEKINKKILPTLLLAFFGLVLLLSVYGIKNEVGVSFGIMSGIFLAFIFVITKKIRERMSVIKIIFYQMLISTIVLSPTILTINFYSVNWIFAIGLGLIPTALAFYFYVYGIKYCKAQEASILALFEPVCVIIFSYVILKESLMSTQIFGTMLILLSIFLLEVRPKKN